MLDPITTLAIQGGGEIWAAAAGILAVLTSVIGVLFKIYHKRTVAVEKAHKEAQEALIAQTKAHTEELGKRDVREATIRGECEKQLREASERFAVALRDEHRENRAHEDALRREFVEVMDKVNAQAQESAKGMTAALDRVHTFLARPSRAKH